MPARLHPRGGGSYESSRFFWSSWGDSVTFLVARKLPIQQQLQGGRAHFASQCTGMQSVLVGKAWSQVQEAAGPIAPAVRKRGAAAKAAAQLVVSRLSSPEFTFATAPFQLNLSGNILIGTILNPILLPVKRNLRKWE